MNELQRNEEAVSAAIATVLLFGGVLSIISIMMVTMIPVIEELEGSVERHDMAAQMTQFNQQTTNLAEQGMPGDMVTQEFVPVDGSLEWDAIRSGMWYSSTWEDGHSFRIRDVIDFDDELQLRHSESMTSSVCFSDMRLGPDRPFHYTAPTWANSVILTTKPGLSFPLGPIEIDLLQSQVLVETAKLFVDDIAQWDLNGGDYKIESTQELEVYWMNNGTGSSEIQASDASANGKGRSWALPLPQGTVKLNIVSDDLIMINGNGKFGSFTEVAVPSELLNVETSWSKSLTLDSAQVLHLTTTADAQLMLSLDTLEGATAWKSNTGTLHGTSFIPPSQEGYIVLTNPNAVSATATWRGNGITLAAMSSDRVQWPPSGITGAATINSDFPVGIQWQSHSEANGVFQIGAVDTGMESGKEFHLSTTQTLNLELRSNGQQTLFNASNQVSNNTILNQGSTIGIPLEDEHVYLNTTEGYGMYATAVNGTIGLMQAMNDGERRCVDVSVTASGWVDLKMPWESMGGRSIIDMQTAWQAGTYPASVHMQMYGMVVEEPYTPIGSAWIMQISRFTYAFDSSVTGMEVAMTGGAVVTNHPEFNPTVIVSPSDRGGPGPRFAATIPSLHPTSDSSVGGGNLLMEVTLSKRTSLASDIAYEVRRGWAEPYGEAIALASTDGLESSLDWTIYPGRLDLLTDYVGWVPDPGYGTSEAIWHTAGEPIQFSLQISSLDAYVSEVIA